MDNLESPNNDQFNTFTNHFYPNLQEQPAYENHVIPTSGDGLLSGLFDMVGEITKDAVGLTKAIGGNIAELGKEITEMMDKDAPDIPNALESQEAAERRTLADAQWQEILLHRAQQQDLSLDR